MDITREQQIERLQELHRVAKLHADVEGAEPVKLNGDSRLLDMYTWECETSACLLGSYCLTDLGKQYFGFVNRGGPMNDWWAPYLRDEDPDRNENPMTDGAEHFGITNDEACYLFNPGSYNEDEHDLSEVDNPEDPDEVENAPILADAVLKRTQAILDKYEVPYD